MQSRLASVARLRKTVSPSALNLRLRSSATAALVALVPMASQAQDGASARGLSITPLLSLGQSFTDNRDLRSVGKEWDAVTLISPGVRVVSRTGRVQGTLDYSLAAQVHAQGGVGTEVQNSLSAAFSAEAIENRAFVDVRASIAQQSISAFGVQAVQGSSPVANRTEVATVSVSPFIRGNIAGVADVEARASHSITHSRSNESPDSTASSVSLRASGRVGAIGWSADASEQTSDYDRGRRTTTGRLGGGLNFSPHPEVRMSARLGRENNDVLSSQRAQSTTWGVSLDWTPTERTQVLTQLDHRYFGNSHSITFQHRFPRSIWRFTDSRDATNGAAGTSGQSGFTVYDLVFAQFASLEPDPTRRDVLVRNYLAFNGFNANAGLGGGFLSSAVSLLSRQDVSVSLQGLRTTVLLSAFRTETRRLDQLVTGVSDDLTRTNLVRQMGYNMSVGYRLTPTASANLSLVRLKTLNSGLLTGNDQRTFNASFSDQLSLRTFLSLSLRHVSFDSATQPYTENGISATLSLRF